MNNFSSTLFAMYPQARTYNSGTGIALDDNGNEVAYDKSAVDDYVDAHAYIAKRASEYPPITDYIDGVVKGDQAQIDAYIAACQAVKTKYPKPE